ncbi:hypothetical protein AAZX31_15G200000 [Glycine max]
MPARSRDALCQEFMMKHEYESLKEEDKAWGTIKVIYAKLSKYGSPLVIFATRHAFLFDTSLKCWLRVTNDYFPASNFASSWCMGLIQSGELAAFQVDVRKYLAWKPSLTRN